MLIIIMIVGETQNPNRRIKQHLVIPLVTKICQKFVQICFVKICLLLILIAGRVRFVIWFLCMGGNQQHGQENCVRQSCHQYDQMHETAEGVVNIYSYLQ